MPKPSPPSQLAELQALMARAVMRPLNAREGMQTRWSDGSSANAVAGGFIKPNDRLSSFERLEIYNQQYWWRLQTAFAEDFRGLRAVLGERRFGKLSTAYLDECGSRSWTMRDLGSALESFIHQHPALTAPHTALALDMTRVEWARVIAFDGEDKLPLNPATLANIPAAELRLQLQPYLTLLELRYPIDTVLSRLKLRASVGTASASNAVSPARPRASRRMTAQPAAEPVYLAVHRVDFSVYYKRLEAPAFRLLTLLREETFLETACEQAFNDCPDSAETNAAKLQTWFADWMRFGWFV